MHSDNDLTYSSNNADFEDDELGITNTELEERLAKLIELMKQMAHLKGAPTAEFDVELKKPYLLYPDGRREYYGN